MKRPLRLLFAGCGVAAKTHSRVLRRRDGVTLMYASRSAERAEAYRRQYGGTRAFRSYEEAIASDADVVVVTTPTSLHLELAAAALEAGKSVIVEKPAFMRSCDVDVVQALADRHECRVFVAENYFYKPLVTALRETIGRGDLGEVRFVSLNATKLQHRSGGWRGDLAMSGGGAMFEGGIHWVSFASNLGLEVDSVEGFPTSSESSAMIVLRYLGGAVGTVTYSWELRAPFGGLRLSKIQGTEGAATFESNGVLLVTTGRRRSIGVPSLLDLTGTRAMWSDFLSCLRTGRAPRFTLQMAQRDLRFLEEAGVSHIGGATLVSPR